MESSVDKRSSANLNQCTSAEDMSIVEALHQKRRSLDQEISQYQALKDEEFRQYEEKLRRHSEERRRDVKTEQESGSSVRASQQNDTVLSPLRIHISNLRQPRVSDTAHAAKAEGHGQSNASATKPDHSPSPDSPYLSRELELREFVPSYLPLLDSSQDLAKQNANASSPPLHSKPSSTPVGRRVLPAPLSSSAILPSTIYNSLGLPSTPSTVSHSAPRPGLDHRSSSRSDNSASLRSSLKQPKSPRSPKHVLFAIDDIVVSPSSSPLAHRNSGPPIPFSGLIDMPNSSLENKLLAQATEKVGKGDSKAIVALKNISKIPNQESILSPSSASKKSYHQLVEPVSGTPSATEQDFELDNRDDDNLFTFDEEIHLGIRNLKDFETSEDDKDDESGNEGRTTPVTASPHAGSLPIEIKWPLRRQSRS